MTPTTTADVTPEKVAEYEGILDQYLAKMEQIQKDITGNQQETARLRAETEVMLKNTMSLLKVD